MSFSNSGPMLIGLLGLTLSGCGNVEPETAGRCIERFENLGNPPHGFSGGTFSPIFTYDIS